MKAAKRFWAILLALCLAAILAPMALAADTETSGTCGDDLTWSLNTETGVLTISGTGNMTDWSSISDVDWYSYRTSITQVVIEDGVTSIGAYAFYNCSSLTSVVIPETVTSIESCAFSGCTSLIT
ncbi:MAG: leucine-rich repeat domain-containing protein, partial [Oscillospiraceae bacterium]|nr:leucine-rich repeat domain-containing protein [Oscillospiraceae bacterium]